jgi:putative GTP pyrophosphokinase
MRIGNSEQHIIEDITEQISEVLGSAGLFHRVFSRLKSPASTNRKIIEKKESYIKNGKKIQDFFGCRVTVYFSDDEDIAITVLKEHFQEVVGAHSIDSPDNDRFGPKRLNLIFRLDDKYSTRSSIFTNPFIDSTFEVQFRTVFSEGWHEVEHDLRYKCKEDWDQQESLSRQLNGQLATLETCNWAMLKIFDELAYNKYQSKDWTSFFRNTMRIRFEDDNLSDELIAFLDNNINVAKELLKADRKSLILPLTKLQIRIPFKMENIFFVVNRSYLHNDSIINLEPPILKNILDKSF